MIQKAMDVTKLVNSVVTIASLPSIYFRVSEAVNCPRSSATDIANVVSEDPGLTARLLKIVNSSFFSFNSKIDTVSRSVSIVGTQQLCDLCLATSVMKAFKDVPEELVSMESFWLHSLACGICARILATEYGVNNVERFFVAGLLHDIGSLILYMKMSELARGCLEESRKNKKKLHEVERQVFGYDHAEVGYELVKLWNLPEALHEAVRFHHAPQRAVDFPLEAAIIHASDIIVSALKLGSNGDTFVPPLVPKAWLTVNIAESSLPGIVENIDGQIDDVVRVMFKE
ncbi:MAG: HDOD domain-containing protein [Deltaproteobacteria bacterium]|nr:HDOD domain-containing protein [Deltaproteobacteria bacterium]